MGTAPPETVSHCLLSLLTEVAERRGNALAVLAPTRKPSTYSDVLAQLRAIGERLAELGYHGESRIAVVAPDSSELAMLMLGLMSHTTALPCNPRLPAPELAKHLRHLRAEAVIIVPGEAGEAARAVATELALPTIELRPHSNGQAAAFELRSTETARPNASHDPRSAQIPGGTTIGEMLRRRATDAESFTQLAPRGGDDVAFVVCTSGTTGKPKVVPLSHDNVFSMMLANCGVLGLTENDRCLSVMPLFHIHGLGAVLCSLLAGGSVVVTNGFSAESFYAWLDEFQPTWYTAVPTIHQTVFERAPSNQSVIDAIKARGGLKLVRSGSAPMPRELPPKLEALFGATYVEASGATEASAYICSNRPESRRIGSVGLPMPETEVRILDDAGQPLGPNETGELVARGPGIFSGYEADEDATRAAFTPDRFFRTGDLGHYDSDGYFYIAGRLKEQINRAGMKISPAEVEAVLMSHESVAAAVSFAFADERLGQEVAAAVVLKKNARASELDLQRFAAARLADHKVPRRVIFVPEIPKGPSGKVRRVGLADQLGLHSNATTPNATKTESTTTATSAAKSTKLSEAPGSLDLNDGERPRTAFEQALTAIWSDVLKREVLNIDAPFFALGGDSLQAVNACLAIERRFNRSIPLAALTARPTVRQLAQLLEDDGLQLEPGAPIVLRDGLETETTPAPILFVLPGVGGNIYSYHGVARRLPAAWRVVGLPLPGADGLEPPLLTFDAVADRFAQVIQDLRPAGPVALCGYSFGGRVAFEVARRLMNARRDVNLLAVFDTPAPGWPKPLTVMQRVALHAKRVLKHGPAEALRQRHEAKTRAERRARLAAEARKLGATAAPGRNSSPSNPSDPLDAVIDAVARVDGAAAEIAAKHDAIVANYRVAAKTLQAKPLDVAVHVFRATQSVWRDFDVSDRSMGWQAWATRGVRVLDVPGSHGTILNEPHVTALATQLTSVLPSAL